MARKPTNWSLWGPCPTCQQTPRGPCFDMRYVKYGHPVGNFYRNTPHADRAHLTRGEARKL